MPSIDEMFLGLFPDYKGDLSKTPPYLDSLRSTPSFTLPPNIYSSPLEVDVERAIHGDDFSTTPSPGGIFYTSDDVPFLDPLYSRSAQLGQYTVKLEVSGQSGNAVDTESGEPELAAFTILRGGDLLYSAKISMKTETPLLIEYDATSRVQEIVKLNQYSDRHLSRPINQSFLQVVLNIVQQG